MSLQRVLSEIMKEEENKLAFNKMKAQQAPMKKVRVNYWDNLLYVFFAVYRMPISLF